MVEQHFFELLQVAIGNKDQLSSRLSDEEWAMLFDIAKKQALVGITFEGIVRLPEEQRPPELLFLKWSGLAVKIGMANESKNALCEKVCLKFQNDGFCVCLLKGQGNLANYPEHLRCRRTSGDIDVWLIPKEKTDHPVRRVVEFALHYTPTQKRAKTLAKMRQHHIDFPSIDDTDVEVHFHPSYFNHPIHNKRFLRWCGDGRLWIDDEVEVQGVKMPLPKPAFNAVYQLVHIYRHLFTEGIGLRQVMDYYWTLQTSLLREASASPDGFREEAVMTLESFGMKRFAGAIMYVLQSVFAMPEEYLLCPADPVAGQFVLDEIMQAGNFGKYDVRNVAMKNASKLKRFYLLTRRNWRFLSLFPSEILFDPFRRGWNVVWRRLELWRWE